MTWQWIIVGLIVAAAIFYIGRLIARTIKNRGCAGCAPTPKTNRLLKKLRKTENR